VARTISKNVIMSNYGFTIHADQDVVKTMRDIQKSMQQMTSTVTVTTEQAERRIEHMGETARKIGGYIAEAFAVREVYRFGKELLDLTAEFEGFTNVIRFSSRNSYDAGQNLEYIHDIVKKLHLPLKETMQGFSEMQAGLIGTGIEGDNLRKVFEGIATASSVLHLPVKNLEMILYDFKEIGERGLNMRNWMSLSGWFPGIGNIVHETFGKGFHELEKEGMAPGDFLSRLGEGMSKHFASGLPNAGNSLISQMNDTKNAMLDTFLKMGEELRPVFVEIMQQIRGIFNSDMFKGFVNNIRPIVETVMQLAKAWVVYSVAVAGSNVVMAAYNKVLTIVTEMQALSGLGMTKMAFLMEELNGAFAISGIGAFAVLLGYLVSSFMDLNKQMEESLEKFSHLKELQAGQEGFSRSFERVRFAFRNQEGKTPEEKAMNLSEMESLIKQISTHYNTTQDQVKASEEAEAAYEKKHKQTWYIKRQEQPQKDAILDLKRTANADLDMMRSLQEMVKLMKINGVKPYVQQMPHSTEVKKGSLQTMGLAGAKGGLGEAKVVNIHIGTMQRVDVKTPAGIKQAAEDGLEVLLRMLNNLAYGRSATM